MWKHLAISLVCAATTGLAATYYVDPESRGGPADDANPGTKKRPWRSLNVLAKAPEPGEPAGLPRAGDTVYVRGGTYAEPVTIRRGGEADRPLVIKAFPGERPVFKTALPKGVEARVRRPPVHTTLHLPPNGRADHVVIDGLVLSPEPGIVQYVVFARNRRNVRLENIEASGGRWGVSIHGSENCTLRRSRVHHNSHRNVSVYASKHITIENNRIHHSGGDEIKIFGQGTGLVLRSGAVASLAHERNGRARFAMGKYEYKVGNRPLPEANAVLFFSRKVGRASWPKGAGLGIPGGTIAHHDGRHWYRLESMNEDGTGVFETGTAEPAALDRAKWAYIASFRPQVWSKDIFILDNEVGPSTVGRGQNICTYNTDGVLIRGNKVHHSGVAGIQIECNTHNIWIENNDCYANSTWANWAERGIWVDETIDGVIQNNRLHENGVGYHVSHSHWILFRNNLVYNNKNQHYQGGGPARKVEGADKQSRGVLVDGGRHYHLGAPPGATHNVLVHNTLYDNAADVSKCGSVVSGNTYTPGVSPNNHFVNNLVQKGNGAYINSFQDKPGRVDGNIYHSTAGALRVRVGRKDPLEFDIAEPAALARYRAETGYDAHSTIARVRFVDAEHADFRLMPGSPAIDAGQPLARTTQAGRGHSIPVDDVSYFSAGFRTSTGTLLVPGDRIVVGRNRVRITKIDRERNVLSVDRNVAWQQDAPVSYVYADRAPDVGALESGSEKHCRH